MSLGTPVQRVDGKVIICAYCRLYYTYRNDIDVKTNPLVRCILPEHIWIECKYHKHNN